MAPERVRGVATTIFEVAGLLLLVGGVAHYTIAGALITAGTLILAAGVIADLRRR